MAGTDAATGLAPRRATAGAPGLRAATRRGATAPPTPASVGRPSAGHRRTAAFVRNPSALIGTAVVLAVMLLALAAPGVAPFDPVQVDLEQRLQGPSPAHWLGTDQLGRDLSSRLLVGARPSLVTALAAVTIVMLIAVTVGSVSGYVGGLLDATLMRVVDVLLAFPTLILAIAVASMLGPSYPTLILALAGVWWVSYARIIRGMAASTRRREYVLAAVAAGAGHGRIVARYVVPNILGPIVVLATLDVGNVILAVVGLTFLGLGSPPPAPEWGAMLNEGFQYLNVAPHLILFPGLAIGLTVLGFNLVGDGLRDALDPR